MTLISRPIKGYNHERYDRNRHGGGVLVYIKDMITYDRILPLSAVDLCDYPFNYDSINFFAVTKQLPLYILT